MAQPDENSKRTRVEPVFTWLRDNGGADWPARLLQIASGIEAAITPGPLVRLDFEKERRVAPSPRRLAWMINNSIRLAPRDGKKWREYSRRLGDRDAVDKALATLKQGSTAISAPLKLEGPSCADCLIECEHAVIWAEGKRNDWLDPATKWDVARDQLARNAEAAWLLAQSLGKESCLIICHEHRLKHHEEALLSGYRDRTWKCLWPHLEPGEHRLLGDRIGTVTWTEIAAAWPRLRDVLPD